LGFNTLGKKVLIQRGYYTDGYIATVWNIEHTEDEHPRLKFGSVYIKRLNDAGLNDAGHQILPFVVASLPVVAFMEALDQNKFIHLQQAWNNLLSLTAPGMRIFERELIGEYANYMKRRIPPQFASIQRHRVAPEARSHDRLINRLYVKLTQASREEALSLKNMDVQILNVPFDTEDQELLSNGDIDRVVSTFANALSLVPGEFSFKILDSGKEPAPGLISERMRLFVIFRRTE
jgi:hypothetical protein